MEPLTKNATVTAQPVARGDKEVLSFRILQTKEQVIEALEARKQLYHLQTRSTAKGQSYLGYLRIRQNGKLKTWKTYKEAWELPCKYGLKECFRVSNKSNLDFGGMLAVAID